jgi:hypothetical protein
VLKPGGRIAYFSIFIAPEVSPEDRRSYKQEQPELYSRSQQIALLRNAGFAPTEETDVTAEYRRTLEALCQANDRHAGSLRRVRGDKDFEDSQRFRLHRLRGIDEGIIRRSLFVAERPSLRVR